MDYIVHGILQARKLEWVAFSFSSGSSQSRAWTQVSHLVRRFFTCWATREAQRWPRKGTCIKTFSFPLKGFPGGTSGRKRTHLPLQETRNAGSIPGWRRSSVGGYGNPLQYSCLRIQWTEEPGKLYPQGRKELDMTEGLSMHACTHTFPWIFFVQWEKLSFIGVNHRRLPRKA